MWFLEVIPETPADDNPRMFIRTDSVVAFSVHEAEIQVERRVFGPKLTTGWYVRLVSTAGAFRSRYYYRSADDACRAATQVLGGETVAWPAGS